MLSEAGRGSSGSLAGDLGSVSGELASGLSTGASGCTSPGEEDFWTTGCSFGASSGRRKSTDEYMSSEFNQQKVIFVSQTIVNSSSHICNVIKNLIFLKSVTFCDCDSFEFNKRDRDPFF